MNQELLDESDIDSVGENENDIETQEGEEDNNESSTKKSNQSNFKALYKSNKEKERLLAEKDQELIEAQEELRQWRELNPEVVQDLDSKKDIDSVKEEIFTIKNPDAEPHIKLIRNTMNKYGMTITEAWKFVKIDLPKESESKKDFSVGKGNTSKTLDYKTISPADALNLSKEDQTKWRKINMGI